MGFKARVDPLTNMVHHLCVMDFSDGFTSGAAPAIPLVPSVVAFATFTQLLFQAAIGLKMN